MGIYKKLLFISGLCLANFYAFADAEYNEFLETTSKETFSNDEDTESTGWLTENPTYVQTYASSSWNNPLIHSFECTITWRFE